MLFNSHIYIFIFLPIVFMGYYFFNRLDKTGMAKAWLVFSSLFFYSWWNPVYLPLILISIGVNFALGKAIFRSNKNKRKFFITGVIFNVLLLGYFKYTDFFIENLNFALRTNLGLLNLLLPLAISFFTFQQITFLMDAYFNRTREHSLLNYSLFVSFFPQLLAGPIVHPREMMPQFSDPKNNQVNYENISRGIFIFSIGLFKKVMIADTFAFMANKGFAQAADLTLISSWISSLSYTFQLYFDFSGYSDMAIGSALLFNIRLPVNFYSPYKAVTIQDFWQRWHITLSEWFRAAIYNPLTRYGIKKKWGNIRVIIFSTIITMSICGLWHGAGWNFVVWGFLHGIALVVYNIWKRFSLRMNKFAAWLVTFNFVNLAWVFFRADSIKNAFSFIKAMFGLKGVSLPNSLASKLTFLKRCGVVFQGTQGVAEGNYFISLWLAAAFAVVVLFRNSIEFKDNLKPRKALACGICLSVFYIAFYKLSQYSEFLYFNF